MNNRCERGHTMTKERNEKQRLYEDRCKLYQKLCRIGYVPDTDMREAIEVVLSELNARIESIRDELMR